MLHVDTKELLKNIKQRATSKQTTFIEFPNKKDVSKKFVLLVELALNLIWISLNFFRLNRLLEIE